MMDIWLVVLTIVKNMSSSMGRNIPFIMEKKTCLKPPIRYIYIYVYIYIKPGKYGWTHNMKQKHDMSCPHMSTIYDSSSRTSSEAVSKQQIAFADGRCYGAIPTGGNPHEEVQL